MFLSLILLEAPAPTGMQKWATPIMFLLIFVVFYFFMIRPQMRKQKNLKKFHESLNKGDKIVTIGGVHGRITQIENDHIFVEIDNNVKVKLEKSAISQDYTQKLSTNDNKLQKK